MTKGILLFFCRERPRLPESETVGGRNLIQAAFIFYSHNLAPVGNLTTLPGFSVARVKRVSQIITQIFVLGRTLPQPYRNLAKVVLLLIALAEKATQPWRALVSIQLFSPNGARYYSPG